MNSELNKQLHAALTTSGLAAQKETLTATFSNGRATSTRELTDAEARQYIDYLNGKAATIPKTNVANKMRRKIISLAHSMHWHIPGSQKVNMARINQWCKTYGQYHKALNDHNIDELTNLVTQFTLVYESYLSNL